MSQLAKSPWARSWMVREREEMASVCSPSRPRLGLDGAERFLLVFILAGFALLVGVQLGMSRGYDQGKRVGQAELWAQHYDSYAKVQWLIDEADLRAMYERR